MTVKQVLSRALAGTEPADDELADRLPVGFRDKRSPNWVRPEIRAAVADRLATRGNAIQLAIARAGSRPRNSTINGIRHIVEPDASAAGMETAVLRDVIHEVELGLSSAANSAVYAAAFARGSRCECCGVVRSATHDPNGVRKRLYADGTTHDACGSCHAVIEQQILDRLAAEQVDGRRRDDLVKQLLEARR